MGESKIIEYEWVNIPTQSGSIYLQEKTHYKVVINVDYNESLLKNFSTSFLPKFITIKNYKIGFIITREKIKIMYLKKRI